MKKMEYDNPDDSQREEVNLLNIILYLWSEKITILKVVSVFFVLGLFLAFGMKKEYKSECTFILEDKTGGSRVSGILAQFGGIAGLNFGGMKSEGMISPELYQTVVHSTPFLVKIMNDTINVQKFDTALVISEYLTKWEKPSPIGYLKIFTIGLPGLILKNIRSSKPVPPNQQYSSGADGKLLRLSEETEALLEGLKSRVSIVLEKESGILRLTTKMPDPVASAEVAAIVYNDLTEYLIKYKIDKAQVDFNFISERTSEARNRYESYQEKLAGFRDNNKNVTSAYFRTEEERLNSEYQLAFNVFNGLSQQLEESRIRVQEAMPVFKIINPVKIPLRKSSPKRSFILMSMIFLGGLTGVGLVLFKRM
jgi:uncharacterized protein involved in exopolysaccharide biosynthesis